MLPIDGQRRLQPSASDEVSKEPDPVISSDMSPVFALFPFSELWTGLTKGAGLLCVRLESVADLMPLPIGAAQISLFQF